MKTTYILCDRKKELINEWKKVFHDYSNIIIKKKGFFETDCKAVVSPANSYGRMRGGLDYYLSIFFDKNTPIVCKDKGIDFHEVFDNPSIASLFYENLDWTIEKKVIKKIKDDYKGVLPIGKAILIKTDNNKIPYLISAPTMKIPEDISNTDNVYKTTKAILKIAEEKDISSVLIPGLGTGVGKVSAESCATQMEKAFSEFFK